MMRRIRVYIDTSVFGGTQDDEFTEASRRFFRDVHTGQYEILLSAEVYRELESAPEPVREVWKNLPPEYVEDVPITPEVELLAQAYIDAGILTLSSEGDARHVAVAVVAEADIIVSWNFKHIVNRGRIHMYNAVNVLKGYRQIEIFSPLEMGDDEEEII